MIKDSKNVKIISVNPLSLINSNVNGYFEEINGNKYLMLIPTNESKEKIKKLWSKIRYLIRSITKNSDDNGEKDMKINFNLDNDLPIKKTIEIPSMIMVFRAVFFL